MFTNAGFIRFQTGPMVGWHHHHHRGPRRLCPARSFCRDLCAEMTAGDDDRHSARDVIEANIKQRIPLTVGQQELL